MTNIIVLFSKTEEAKSIRSLLIKRGYDVTAVCTTGAQALASASDLSDGIIVCGYRYPDMMYSELQGLLPPYFEMLLLVPGRLQDECGGRGIVCVSMPLKVQDFMATVDMMAAGVERRRKKRRQKPRARSEDERKVIDEAKKLLMERNNLSEEEAYRYLQKCSMDSGTNMVETAQMVLSMF